MQFGVCLHSEIDDIGLVTHAANLGVTTCMVGRPGELAEQIRALEELATEVFPLLG